jgi:hypothetical protein
MSPTAFAVDSRSSSSSRNPQVHRSRLLQATGSVLPLATALLAAGCVDLEPKCLDHSDCASPKVCNPEGFCVYECTGRDACPDGFSCVEHRCEPKPVQPIVCPRDMAAVADTYCIDLFEASRPDATADSAGSDNSAARSVKGVLPWQVPSNEAAAAACAASGKRLCSATEWEVACRGPADTAYTYGDLYAPSACNGIEAFGHTSAHLAATGSFPNCTNGWGVFDMNGNLWEHVAGGTDNQVRGGAYDSGDSVHAHRCDYVPGTWAPPTRGFRCCQTPKAIGTPSPGDADAGALDAGQANAGEDGGTDAGALAPDAGDAGTVAGADAGSEDAGSVDPTDAGSDSGLDASEPADSGTAASDGGEPDASRFPADLPDELRSCIDSREPVSAVSAMPAASRQPRAAIRASN